jgi:hypothetical protein
MSEILAAVAQAEALLRGIAGVDRTTLSDHELCKLVTAEEQLARLIGASEAVDAAEVDDRSRYELGDEGLSMRNSFRKPVPFLEFLTRASQGDLATRVRLGHALRNRRALVGESLPAEFPFVAEGVKSGLVSVEAATAIVRCLAQGARGSEATPQRMEAAEKSLVELAANVGTDDVRAAAKAWREALDPDGAEPRYDEILQQRGLTKGRQRNGITTYALKADPRTSALVDAVLDEATAPGATPRFLSDDDRQRGTQLLLDDADNEQRVLVDPRTRAQKQLDILAGVLTAGLRASHDAAPDLRATGTVTAIVTLAELEAGVGAGWLAGSEEPISIPAIEQMICDAGVRIMVLDSNGKPLGEIKRLGESVLDRYFTATQRRGMLARDGDRCNGPGCHSPAAWCDAHHVEHHSQGGPTSLDNGVLLCGSCHSALHKGAFEIRMTDGIPYVRLGIHADDESAWRRAGTSRALGRAA